MRERGTCTRVHREPGRPCRLRSRERAVTEERGNEARRDGRQGVGACHSTAEVGEPTHRDPVEGRASRVTEPLEGKMAGTPSPDTVSTKLQRIATVGALCLSTRSEPVTRGAGCGSSARPDLWGGVGRYVTGVGLAHDESRGLATEPYRVQVNALPDSTKGPQSTPCDLRPWRFSNRS